MATVAGQAEREMAGFGGIGALVAQSGSAMNGYAFGPMLRTNRHAARNLADAVHFLCEVHGFHPDLTALATESTPPGSTRDWLQAASAAFADERALLTRIVVAAGPIPSTPGQPESEAAALGQRHALEMLGRSERAGCAIGATVALLLDWHAVRDILDLAGDRLGVQPARCGLPSPAKVASFVDGAFATAGVARAAQFGAQQYLLQQQGLWDLLEAREMARRES